mmetsp:Transcript_14682/g.47836  ORF Transcript_14682/g.47836 Transcript_14682/m.47836 type:complete len:195 (+) Transcript_14682:313-897(+)
MFAVSQPHVESFNDLISGMSAHACASLDAAALIKSVNLGAHSQVSIRVSNLRIGYPILEKASSSSSRTTVRLLPRQCRESGLTYSAPLRMNIDFKSLSGTTSVVRTIGGMPIMVRSHRCNLRAFHEDQLIAAREVARYFSPPKPTSAQEVVEVGGYFIINGIERVVRLLQVPKRNLPLAVSRRAYSRRGILYTE